MAINFPSTPAEGQKFAYGNVLYTFTKGVWRAAPLGTARPFNYIVNPSMLVSQQNANTAGTVNGYYMADQWYSSLVTTGAVSLQRVQLATPNGSLNRLRCTVTTADTSLAATEYVIPFGTKIEGSRFAAAQYGGAEAQQLVLRFGWKSPAGTYSVRVMNAAQNYSYIANFTISAGQANTDTEQILVIPGATAGTWVNDDTAAGLDIRWCIAVGANLIGVGGWQTGAFAATPSNNNGMGTISAVFEIFDVGLYLDPNNTGKPPPWEVVSDLTALMDSMRYWYLSKTLIGVAAGTTTAGRMNMIHPVPMRPLAGTPFAKVGASTIYDGTVNNASGALSTIFPNTIMAELNMAATGLVLGRRAMMLGSTGNIGISVSARM